MRKFISSILFMLIAAGVTVTAAHAVQLKIFHNGSAIHTSSDPAITGTCSVAPCTFTVRATIADGTYGSAVNTVGAYVEAKVVTNAKSATDTSFAGAIAASTSITTIINVTGQFRYVGSTAGTIDLETSHLFPLRTGVWNTAGRGGSKCAKQTTGKYAGSSCTNSSSTVESGSCTFCRAYGFTDEGYVTRSGADGSQLPAGDVTITMKSQVGFYNASSPTTLIKTELIGGANPTNPPSANGGNLTWFIDPNSNLVEDGHFYLGTSLTETVPCEPLTGSTSLNCHASERKTSRLTFANLQPNDLVSLPVTSTDVGAADLGILNISLKANIPIDVHPIDPVANSNTETQVTNPLLGGTNNDWKPTNTSGNRHVLALNTFNADGSPNVDVCAITDASLTVAGSQPAPARGSAPYLASDGVTCIGRQFEFDYGDVNPTIPGADKLQTCFANPTATLLISGVPLTSSYTVTAGSKKGGPKRSGAYVPPDSANCSTDTEGNVTCNFDAEVGGTQIIKCCVSCGG